MACGGVPALQTAKVERARIAQFLRQQLATKDQLTQADKAIADAETTLDTLKKSGSGQPRRTKHQRWSQD